jgi:hypothetical protein
MAAENAGAAPAGDDPRTFGDARNNNPPPDWGPAWDRYIHDEMARCPSPGAVAPTGPICGGFTLAFKSAGAVWMITHDRTADVRLLTNADLLQRAQRGGPGADTMGLALGRFVLGYLQDVHATIRANNGLRPPWSGNVDGGM